MISKARMIKAERERAKRKAEEEKKKEEEKAKKEKKDKKKKKKAAGGEAGEEGQSSSKEEATSEEPPGNCRGCSCLLAGAESHSLQSPCFRAAGGARAWPGLGRGPARPGLSPPARESCPPHTEAEARAAQPQLS